MEKMERVIESIGLLDQEMMEKAQVRLDSLTKPKGSLGKLEDIAKQVAGITGELMPSFPKKAVVVMAGDHGVCAEGVSPCPQEVTYQMIRNFLNGGAAISVLSRHVNADLVCVDVGIDADVHYPGLHLRKVRKGTRNMAKEPAMTREEAVHAITVGIDMVDELYSKGYGAFAIGEMGIGNTTPSSALLAVLAGVDVEDAVGIGSGTDSEMLARKKRVIQQAIQVNQPDPQDPLDVLAKVGGLEIAGMAGVILGSAASRCPVVIDGFIASAAALVAARLAPRSVDFMIGSHQSMEKGHALLLEAIGLSPMLQMDMRLGEGTGAVLVFPMIDAAGKVMREMETYESAGVSR
ncbi:nicotinate-nucleotide--dimethylbenzimidazole phosphoribosyltransferase [Brevibacillus ginsengisoli]|uniref:nicotinate-nucleotide--dimethylbenzimidazole phosphoribosyltransferase n=1 Tax=Brevibacillus ginsengisoli TaxID=363854 RepID=UPI003CEC251D